jgi:hypothetical protein
MLLRPFLRIGIRNESRPAQPDWTLHWRVLGKDSFCKNSESGSESQCFQGGTTLHGYMMVDSGAMPGL